MSQHTIKKTLLNLFSIVFLVGFFLQWNSFVKMLFWGKAIGITDYALISFLGVFATVCFLFSSIFLSNPYERFGIIILSFAIPFFFSFLFSLAALAVIITTSVLAILASETINQAGSFNARFSLISLMKSGMPLFFTSLAIILSFAYYMAIPADKALAALLPNQATDYIIDLSGPYLFKVSGLPPLKAKETVKEFLSQYAQTQSQSQGINWNDLSINQRNQIITEAQKQIEKQFGVAMPLNAPIGKIFSKALEGKLNDIAAPFQPYLPLVAAVLFFFVLKTLSVAAYYIVYLIAAFLLYLFKKSSIIMIVKQQIEVERYII